MSFSEGYIIGDCFLSTNAKVAGSTAIVASAAFSSNATSTGDSYYNAQSSYYSWWNIYPKPERDVRAIYQCMFYNPTTNTIACDIMAQQVGITTGSTQDYFNIDSVTIPGTTQAGRGRAMVYVEGLFDNDAVQFRFYNPTSYATTDGNAGTDPAAGCTNYKSYVAVKEYL